MLPGGFSMRKRKKPCGRGLIAGLAISCAVAWRSGMRSGPPTENLELVLEVFFWPGASNAFRFDWEPLPELRF